MLLKGLFQNRAEINCYKLICGLANAVQYAGHLVHRTRAVTVTCMHIFVHVHAHVQYILDHYILDKRKKQQRYKVPRVWLGSLIESFSNYLFDNANSQKNVSSHGGVFVLSKFWDFIIVFSSFRSFVFFFFEFHDFVIYRHPVRMF